MFGDLCIIFIIILPLAKCTVPGRFFWKPRLAIDLTEVKRVYPKAPLHNFTRENVEDGKVVIISGYNVGMTVVALASGISDANKKNIPYLHPGNAKFYTNVYRWFLRYLSSIPDWLASQTSGYPSTHKVWNRRFSYMESFIPNWMRPLLPFIDDKDWAREEKDFIRYRLYAESAFGRHYLHPPTDVIKNIEREDSSGKNLDSSENLSP